MAGPETIETGYAPIKAWVRACRWSMPRAVSCAIWPRCRSSTPRRGDAGRALRHWRHRGLGHPDQGAIIPAAVGVDIGCGMMAVRTTLTASDLPDSLAKLRRASRRPCRTAHRPQGRLMTACRTRSDAYRESGLAGAQGARGQAPGHPRGAERQHLGTLGGGNHFIEVCLDEEDRVWVMLHSGSRGIGNRIGTYFIAARSGAREAAADSAAAGQGPRLARGRRAAVRRLRGSGRLGARLRARQPRGDDGGRASRPARATAAVPDAAAGHQLPPQLRRARAPLRRSRVGDAQGRGARRRWRTRHHPGLDGREVLHRARQGQCGAFQSCSHGAGRRMSRTAAKRLSRWPTTEATAGVDAARTRA